MSQKALVNVQSRMVGYSCVQSGSRTKSPVTPRVCGVLKVLAATPMSGEARVPGAPHVDQSIALNQYSVHCGFSVGLGR